MPSGAPAKPKPTPVANVAQQSDTAFVGGAPTPWTISTNHLDASATLTYTDPFTGKAVSYKFNNAAQADNWARNNVIILPPGAKVVAKRDPMVPGGTAYELMLANGTAHTFINSAETSDWLVSKVGYATSNTWTTYQKQQASKPASGSDASNIVVHPPPGAGQQRPTAGGSTVKSPYELGHPAQTGLEPGVPAAGGPDGAPTDPYGPPPNGGGPGGPGGGNFPGTDTLAPDASPADVEAFVRAHYGYAAWALDIPELHQVLLDAAQNGWDSARLQGAVEATNWWKTHGQNARAWAALEGTDPAEASRQLSAKAGEVGDMARSAGLDGTKFSADRIKAVARDALQFGWSADEIRTVIANEFNYTPGLLDQQGNVTDPAAVPTGDIGAAYHRAKQLAREYMLPLSDSQALTFAKSMYAGELDDKGLAAVFAQQAAARFPALADAIAAGVTPAGYFATYASQIGDLLEKSPDSIDFVKDPRFQKVIDFVDAKGNRRPMTLSETNDYVRTLPEWDTTNNARDQAYAFTNYLGAKFGKAAA